LLAEMVGRSTGQDTMAFAQRELMTALGVEAGSWEWGRDKAGHVQGFSGVRMTPDDYGRLGDLMRRGGVWRGTRLLSREFVRRAITPSKTNGCYGWLIWLNAAQPCISPTVAKRPVKNSRDFPDLPADFYSFSGLFGQRVTMFPTQDVVIVRTGQDPSLVPAGESSWEHELYTRVLGAITDGKWKAPGDAPRVNDERKDVDYGFGSSATQPDEYSKGFVQDDLPPAGPARARAAILTLARALVDRQGIVRLTIACPARTANPCSGTARLTDTKAKRYDVAGGRAETLSFRLSQSARARLRERGTLALTATAVNADAAGGTTTTSTFILRG
jgi:hypothetical protein